MWEKLSEKEINDRLFEVYGFAMPNDFTKIIKTACDEATVGYDNPDAYFRTPSENFHSFFSPFFEIEGQISGALLDTFVLGKEFADQSIYQNFAYKNFPIELFQFGSPGMDGISYGYVVHAPELESKDYPVGEFCPSDDIGVFQLGKDFLTAFEFMIARKLKQIEHLAENDEFSQDFWRQHLIESQSKANELARLFDISANDVKVSKNYYRQKITPTVPSGWRFEATLDGIGVLAPEDKFSPDFKHSEIPDFENIDEELSFIKDFVHQGFPATALWIIRENYWRFAFLEQNYFAQIALLWAEIYEALNRPLLAKRVLAAVEFRKS